VAIGQIQPGRHSSSESATQVLKRWRERLFHFEVRQLDSPSRHGLSANGEKAAMLEERTRSDARFGENALKL
jgi:hypothetical protein